MTNRATPTVTLLPLDDRPVNTSHVAALSRVAGARLLLPPAGLLPPRGAPGDVDGLAGWLRRSAAVSDAVVVSVNQLVHGGFVASRRTTAGLRDVMARLDVLRDIRAERPRLPVDAFVTLMRTKDADDAGAEPEYWARHGKQFFALSTEVYRAEHGRAAAIGAAAAPIPPEHVANFFGRRLRLHVVQLACIDLVADGIVDRLSVAVEDSAVEGVSTSEREWLQAWVGRLGLADRVHCFPGADELGAVLLARALLRHAGRRPTVAVVCVDDDALGRVARYEDVPVRETVAAQAASAGLDLVEDVTSADLVLAVHPPGDPARDWYRVPAGGSSQPDGNGARRLAERVRELVSDGRVVAVADVADANGADPALVTALRDYDVLHRLGGYAGWNTAGNTIGSALAQGVVRLLADSEDQRDEHAAIVAHHLVEDWGYQASARRAVLAAGGPAGVTDGELARSLAQRLGELGSAAERFRLVPGSVRFPWDRSFEVDFDLERRGGDRP